MVWREQDAEAPALDGASERCTKTSPIGNVSEGETTWVSNTRKRLLFSIVALVGNTISNPILTTER